MDTLKLNPHTRKLTRMEMPEQQQQQVMNFTLRP